MTNTTKKDQQETETPHTPGATASEAGPVADPRPPKPDAVAAANEAPPSGETASFPAQAGQQKMAELEKQATELNARLDAAQDKYLRLMAEFDNYKRRTFREYEQVREQATERLMCDLVEVKDNFDRALVPGKAAADYDTFHTGMQLIDGQFVSVLQKHGLSAFGEPGEAFNPELHEALMKQPHDTIAEDHVVQVFDKGYKLRGKVIKHARVFVSAGRTQPPAAPAPETVPPPAAGDKESPAAQTEETVFGPKP